MVAHMNMIVDHILPAMLVIHGMIVLHNIHAISTEIVCVVVNTIQQLVNMIVLQLVLV